MKSVSVKTRWIGLLFVLLAVYAPAFLTVYWAPSSTPIYQVWGMLWWLYYRIDLGGWFLDWQFPFFVIGQSIQFTLLRPLFAFQMVRFYQNKTSKKMTLLVGLLVELQVLVVSLIWSGNIFTSNTLRIPLPVLLLIGYLLMRFIPPKKSELWLEKEEETQEWWNHEN